MSKIKICYFVSGIVSGGVEQMLINYCSRLDKKYFGYDINVEAKKLEEKYFEMIKN